MSKSFFFTFLTTIKLGYQRPTNAWQDQVMANILRVTAETDTDEGERNTSNKGTSASFYPLRVFDPHPLA